MAHKLYRPKCYHTLLHHLSRSIECAGLSLGSAAAVCFQGRLELGCFAWCTLAGQFRGRAACDQPRVPQQLRAPRIGVDAIVRALSAFETSAAVRDAGWLALGNLAFQHVSIAERLASEGARSLQEGQGAVG